MSLQTYRLILVVFLIMGTTQGLFPAKTAADYLKIADDYNKKKDFQNAEKYYLLAEAGSDQGFYSARKGQFYHFSTREYDKAIPAFAEAYRKGFRNSWLFVQWGNSYRYTGRPKEAEECFRLGVKVLQEKIAQLQEKGKSPDGDINSLLNLYAQYCAMFLDLKDFKRALEVGQEGYKLAPATVNNSFLTYFSLTYYWLSLEDFGYEQWAGAIKKLEFARELVTRDEKLKQWYEGEYLTLLKVYRDREQLGAINPGFTHTISLVIIPETNAAAPYSRGPVPVTGKVSPAEEYVTGISVRFLKGFIEAATGGTVGINYTIDKPSMVLSSITLDENIETDQRKNRYPDLNFLCREYESFFLPKIARTDTFVFIWSAREFNTANGGERRFILPRQGISVKRGYAHIPSERMAHNGPDLLLHEFFHVIEHMTSLPVSHGYYDENRGAYPLWKGTNGNDYYYWQLSRNIPLYLKQQFDTDYRVFNFREKFPVVPGL